MNFLNATEGQIGMSIKNFILLLDPFHFNEDVFAFFISNHSQIFIFGSTFPLEIWHN